MERDYSKVEGWKDAVEHSRISRINWKDILGKSMGKYILEKKSQGVNKEDVLHEILLKCRMRKNTDLKNWDFEKVVQNVKIGISARYGEMKLYGKI